MGPTQECQHESLACYIAQESLKKEEEKDAQVVAEEELEEVDMGSGSQELVLLLKEFKDVFA